jgi:hypothetical protein
VEFTRDLISACAGSAQRQGAQSGKTAVQVLEAVIDNQFTSVAKNGRTVVTTSEAGGSVTFHIDAGLNPTSVIQIAQRALNFIKSQADPANPVTHNRDIQRLRVSFAKANLT